MSENNLKSNYNDYCKFCGNKISVELSKKIKANKENVVCELCGCQLLLITNTNKEQNKGTELITDIKKEHHNEITEDLKEIYRLNIYNADREKFGYYLTIFISRSIYNIIKQSNLGLNITDIQIEMISNSIMVEIINNRVDKEWLSDFKPIKKNFKKFYKKLQSELSSNQALQEVFWEFFRLLAKIIIKLINKKDYSELQEIEYDIAEYLIKRDLFVSNLRFTVPFRYNLKICLSRLIFLRIKDIACKSNLKFCQLKLSNIEKRNISDEIIKYLTSHNEIINKFLGELYKIKPYDFNEFYKYLCLELKSDNLFAESFNYYLRWLIGHIHNIVCGKYKWKELSHFDRIIATKLAELIDVEVDFEKIGELKKKCQNTVEITQENPVNPEVNELSAEIKKDNIELLKERYKQETGGRAIYAGKETKGFKSWKEHLNETQEKINEEISSTMQLIDAICKELLIIVPQNELWRGRLADHKVSKFLGQSSSFLKHTRNRIKNINPNYTFSKELLKVFIDNLYNNFGQNAKKCVDYIVQYSESNPNLKSYSGQQYQIHNPDLKADYFDIIDSIEKAYWLGFLCADGSITSGKTDRVRYQIAIELSIKDKDQLIKFCESVGLNPDKIGERDRTIDAKVYRMTYIEFTCKPMYETLEEINFKKFPQFSKREYLLGWLLGFYDGDGISKRTDICSADKHLLELIKDKFNIRYPVSLKLNPSDLSDDVIIKSNKPIWRLTMGATLFNELLRNYKNSMERKRHFMNEYREIYENLKKLIGSENNLQKLVENFPKQLIADELGINIKTLSKLMKEWGVIAPRQKKNDYSKIQEILPE